MTNLLLQSLILSMASSVIPEGNSSYDKAIDTTLNILIPCTVKSSNNKILLAGEYTDFLMSRRHFFGKTPIALVGETKNSVFDLLALTHQSFIIYKKRFHEFVRYLYKLRFFVVITSSQPILKMTLRRIKDTTWANSNGCFIMVDKRTGKRGCGNAYSYLWTAWQFDLLRSIFICDDPKEGVLLYSYDPYTAQASGDWTEVKRFSGRKGHPWLLLKKKYDEESSECQFKKIKKTSALYGYEVKLCAKHAPPRLIINDNITGLDRFGGDNGMIIKTILQKLNATINVTVKRMLFGGINKYGRMTDVLGEVANGVYDMGMNSRIFTTMWHLSFTYPHEEAGICAISQSSREISELRKLMILLTTPFMMISMILCMITLLIIMKFDGFFEACLNVERLIVCVAMLRLPNINSFRIYICMIFLLSLTANAVFQSHWYSLLTIPQFYSNIDDYDDLKDSGYDIYRTISYKDVIGDELESRSHETSYVDCTNIVKNTSTVVCISDCFDVQQRVLNERKLHASKHKIREFVSTFIARENWPIFETFSKNLQKLVESGLVSLWRERANARLQQEIKLKELNMTGFKVLKFRHLDFSFYILLIGNSCAFLVFAMELMIHRHHGATFQGSLSSLLTSPVQKSNIDSIKDLKNSGYKVYIFSSYKNIIFHDDIVDYSRLKFIDHWNCTKYVLEEENVGCAAERLRLMKIGFENNLHVSKHRLISLYSAYVVRPNWPLNDRVSNLLQRMWQCGLIRYWITETAWNYKPEWLFIHEKLIKPNNYRSLTLTDLSFVFYILLFGFVASILVFFLERLFFKGRKKSGK